MFNHQPKYPFIKKISAFSMAVKLGALGMLNPLDIIANDQDIDNKPASTTVRLWEQGDKEQLATLLLLGQQASDIVVPNLQPNNLEPISDSESTVSIPATFGELVVQFLDDGQNPISADVVNVVEQGCDYNLAIKTVAKAWGHDLLFNDISTQQDANSQAGAIMAKGSNNLVCPNALSTSESESTDVGDNTQLNDNEPQNNDDVDDSTDNDTVKEDKEDDKNRAKDNEHKAKGNKEWAWLNPRTWWKRDN